MCCHVCNCGGARAQPLNSLTRLLAQRLSLNPPTADSKLGEPRATAHSIFQHTLTTSPSLLFTLFSSRIVHQRHVGLGYVASAILHVLTSPTTATTSSRSEPYDPYLPRGGSSANPSAPGGSAGPNPKTAHIQAQIDDTVNIMRDNITKVVERQERLDSLQDKTGWCFSSTMPVLPPLFCPSVVGVKPCQYDVDAHTLVLASRQPCRFRSRFQAQRESRPEGTFGFFCFVRYSS